MTRAAIAVLFVFALVLGGFSHAAGQVASPGVVFDPAWPLSAAFVETFEGELPESMPQYEIDVTLDANARTLTGSLRVEFTNHTGEILSEIPLRLYPNADYYGEGGTTIERVQVDGALREPELSTSDTVLTVSLGRLLGVERSVEIEIDFETVVPIDSGGSFGIFSHDSQRLTWVLADWYPIVAGWDADTGWGLEPPTAWGDPTFSETSLYDVQLAVPTGMSVVSTGEETRTSSDASNDTYEIVTGPVRELAMVLDDGFVTSETTAADVSLHLHLNEESPAEGADGLLSLAAETLTMLSDQFGRYPYQELDIVQTELAGALGVSWSGILFIDAVRMENDLAAIGNPDGILPFTVVHEIAHQWWGSLVGVNSNDHAYLNESMANYLTIFVYESVFGAEEAQSALLFRVAGPYVAYLEEIGDGIVDRPIWEFGSTVEFARLIYGKGGLGLLAIRNAIGDEAFFGAVAAYCTAHAFQVAGPTDLLQAFDAAGETPVVGHWSSWFEEASTTVADVEMLLAAAYST